MFIDKLIPCAYTPSRACVIFVIKAETSISTLCNSKHSDTSVVHPPPPPIQARSPIHTGRETTHTHTRVRGRLFSAFHCNINSNVMKLHSEIEFKLLQNNINDKIFSQAIL